MADTGRGAEGKRVRRGGERPAQPAPPGRGASRRAHEAPEEATLRQGNVTSRGDGVRTRPEIPGHPGIPAELRLRPRGLVHAPWQTRSFHFLTTFDLGQRSHFLEPGPESPTTSSNPTGSPF